MELKLPPGGGVDWAFEIARAAGWDAGNRSMRAAGRQVWNEDDKLAAWAEMERLLGPVDPDATGPTDSGGELPAPEAPA
jgi:hypothetical protein